MLCSVFRLFFSYGLFPPFEVILSSFIKTRYRKVEKTSVNYEFTQWDVSHLGKLAIKIAQIRKILFLHERKLRHQTQRWLKKTHVTKQITQIWGLSHGIMLCIMFANLSLWIFLLCWGALPRWTCCLQMGFVVAVGYMGEIMLYLLCVSALSTSCEQ